MPGRKLHDVLRWGNKIGLLSMLVFATTLTQAANALGGTPDASSKPLILGYFPVVSTVALFKRFSPLRDYLAEALGRPVVLQTAKDFPTFVSRTDARRYDLVVTAPHFALRATDSGKYVVRATVSKDVQQLFVVRSDSPVSTIADLAGKNIATPPTSALMTMMGKRYLMDAGLVGDRQPVYRPFTSHNAANQAVIAKEMDAAIASSNIIQKAIKRGDALRILAWGETLPNMAMLVASDLDGALGARVSEILVGMKNSKHGQQVLKQIAFPGYRVVSAQDYEAARIYMEKAAASFDGADK